VNIDWLHWADTTILIKIFGGISYFALLVGSIFSFLRFPVALKEPDIPALSEILEQL
jgi:hypothetical protein